MPRLTHSLNDLVAGSVSIIVYAGYKLSDRDSRWYPKPGEKAIVIAKVFGKLGSYTPVKEYRYPEGNRRRRLMAIRFATKWVDGVPTRRRRAHE